MNSSSLDVFCPKHLDSEAPISDITEILSEIDSLKFKNISDEFEKLGFTKVKDLARATLEKLPGDTLTHLYKAMKIYSERLDELLNTAKSENKNRNFIETQKICKVLLTHKPRDLNVLLLNANSFFECENYEDCIDCLEKARTINPNCSEVFTNFGLVYAKQSENDAASECLFKVCAIKPYSVEAWTNYADFLFRTNDLVLADFAYTRALTLRPELNEVRNNYGKLLIKANKINEAKNQFKIALNRARQCPVTLSNLADVYYISGKFEKSILKYKEVLDINPDQTNAYYFLGMGYLNVSEYQNAINAFKKGIALDPENIENIFFIRRLAVAYCHLGDMELCVEAYKKCLDLKPEDFNLNMDLALVYFHNIRNYLEASIYLQKCIQLNPDRIDLYKKLFIAYKNTNDHLNASDACMSMGDLYLEKDDYENARNAFCTAAVMNRRNAFSHWKTGLAFYKLGQSDLALKKYKHAIAVRPDFSNAYCDMGLIYYERGLLEQAKVHYEKAIKLSPNDHIDARLKLNDILMKQMDPNNAVTDNENQ